MALVVERFPDLGITRLSRWIFNCYLLRGDEMCVVVDAGLPCTPADIAQVLERTGESVRAVVATHGHSDHLAGAPQLASHHAAALYLPEVTVGYLRGRKPRTP